MFTTKPLDGPFGVEIHGLDLGAPQPTDVIARLIAVFHTHQVIKIPDQRIGLDDFARLGKWFGNPHAHVVEMGHVPGYPYMSLLTNQQEVRRNQAAYWHTDNTYEAQPASATMLWAKTVPSKGGATMVADMYTAYESLPAAMRQRIDGLKTLNGWVKRDEGYLKTEMPPVPMGRQTELGVFVHPLVLTHPVTGRKALFSVTGSSFGIEGMPADEGLDLLRELTAHATQEKFQLSVAYAERDIAAWDTLATLHAATPHADPNVDQDMLREMYRISVKGLSPYAQPAASLAVAETA